MKPTLSIVIPVYNEEGNLPELMRRTLDACRALGCVFEIVLVNDGSQDRSAELLVEAARQHPREIVAVLLNRNYGQHNATFAGYAQARGELVINLDADLQNPPEEIHKIYDKLCEGFDVVAGVRAQREDSALRKIPSALANGLIRRSTGVAMKDYGCMLRGYTRAVVQAMLACEERTPFIPVLANSFAHRIAEVDVAHASRGAGTSTYSALKLINLTFDMLTGMTTMPLRLLTFFGAAVCALSVLAAFVGLGAGLATGAAGGALAVGLLCATLFFLAGALFIGLGLLGEYVGRIHVNVRARPRYLIHQIHGESAIP